MHKMLRSWGTALACLLVASSSFPQSYTFRIFAGNGGNAGTIDGTGAAVRFADPRGIAVDASSNVYVVDGSNNVIRKITPSGMVTTFAGVAGAAGSADGRRSAARFWYPASVAFDGGGAMYLADAGNHVIRKITPAGQVTTIGGSAGVCGYVDGSAAVARFCAPQAVAVDSGGNLFVTDAGNAVVRQITPAGVVSTIAGTPGVFGFADGAAASARFSNPTGIVLDPLSSALYVNDYNNVVVRKISGGNVSTLAGSPGSGGLQDGMGSAARFSTLLGIAAAPDGTLYVADRSRIRSITPDGLVTTIVNPSGSVGSDDGPPNVAKLRLAGGVAVAPSGALYVTDSGANTIRKVAAGSYDVSTFAGHAVPIGSAEGTGTGALFTSPTDVVSDAAGNVYVAESTKVRKITPDGVVSTLAGSDWSGYVDGPGADARFRVMRGLAFDPSSSTIYVADTGGQTIRRITLDGVVTTVAGVPDTTGSQNGPVATATFNNPSDVAVDAQGNVYVAEYINSTIRKISGGQVSTLAGSPGECGSADGTGTAARFCSPLYLAVASTGNIIVVDMGNATVRTVTPDGVVTTLAGSPGVRGSADGTGSAALFSEPRGIAAGGAGSVYVVDSESRTLRRISAGGVVTTIAGIAGLIGTTDGTDSAARFERPQGVGIDPAGSIYVADYNGIRRGTIALPDRAVIDVPAAAAQIARQLDAAPRTATSFSWSIIRRPADSEAELSNSAVANPTFTPDAPDLYVFSLTATNGTSTSITEVALTTTCPAIQVYPSSLRDVSRDSTYSEAFFSTGSVVPYKYSFASGLLPSGLTVGPNGVLSGRVSPYANPTTYRFVVRSTDRFDCTADKSCSLVVRSLVQPTGLVATAATSTSVRLVWTRHPSAAHYGIVRRDASSLGSYSMIATVPQPGSGSPTYLDATARADSAYMYAVGAIDATNVASGSSVPDLATTVMFRNSIAATVTPIRAVDFTELRTAVNAVGALSALPPPAFTDRTLSSSVVVKREHMLELRAGLDAARAALALAPLTYTDPSLAARGTTIKAAHIIELRNGVK